MANDKKFIAKNGFLTSDADSSFTNSTSATPTVTFTNSGGAGASSLPGSGAVIAKFAGNSDAMVITNVSDGDYFFGNNQQNNGINFYDGTGGMEFFYNGVEKFSIDSNGTTFATGHTTTGTTITDRLKVEDNGSTSPLVVIKGDDASPWALAIGNDTYSTTETMGHLFYQADAGDAYYQIRGNGVYENWNFQQHNGSTSRTQMRIASTGHIELASNHYVLWGVGDTNRPGFLGDNTNKVLQFHNNGAERMRLDGSGNVGIGTQTATSGRVHVHGGNVRITNTSDVGLKLRHTTATFDFNILQNSNGDLELNYGTTDFVRIKSSGNVGIGSNANNPQYKLDVDGTSRVTGGLTISPGSSGHTSFELGSRSADPLPAATGSYDFKPGMRVGSYELGDVNAAANIALAWATNDVSTSSPGYLPASQSYAGASWSQSFTVTQVAGTRWFVKVKLNDAESGNDPRLAVNGGTEYRLEYLDAVNASGEAVNDSDTWHVIDVTDDIVTGNNVLKVWLNAGQKTYILAAYVFASTGIALPNEPAESTFYAHDGFGVQDTLIIDKARDMQNINSVGVGTNTNAYGRLQVNQTANNDESGIGILDSTDSRSMRLWTDSTTAYVNSGNGGAGTLILNEGTGNVGIQNTSPNFPLHINKGTSSYSPSPGVNENVFGVNSTYDAAGSQYITFSRLDGNWLDGTTGADSAFGWLWNFQNSVRGGMMYDHRSTEQFQIFSSYAPIVFYTPDAADGNGVPTDSNMNERMKIMPGGEIDFNGIDGGAGANGKLQRITSAYFVNNESDNISTTLSETNGARLFFDHNFYNNETAFSDVFSGDGGGFAYYGGDQINWTAIYDTENTQYAKGTWRELVIAQTKSDATGGQALYIDYNITNPAADFAFGQYIDVDTSGSAATGGDREQGGLRINLNSTTTGGNTADEHRVYGIHIDTAISGDADSVNGIYTRALSNLSSGTTTNLWGIDAYAEADNGTGTTISNAAGVRGNAYVDNVGSSISNGYGGYFRMYQYADGGSVTGAYGVYGELELNNTTAGNNYTTGYAFRAEIDNNTSRADAIGTSYLYYGNYSGTIPTNAYGVYILDSVPNYFSGNIRIGDLQADHTTSSLSVYHATNSQMQFTNSTTGNADSNGFRVGHNGTQAQLYNFHNSDMGFATNNQQRMTIKDNGGVEIHGKAVLGTSTQTADGQNDIMLFATGIGGVTAHSGAFHSKLRILGGSGQSRDLQLYQVDSEYAHIGSSWTSNQLTIDSAFTQVNFNQPIYVSGNTVWNAGNDGSGSGLDADNLDGVTWGNINTTLQTSSNIKAYNGTTEIKSDGIYFESGTHCITWNDGRGNFNVRVGHDVNENVTETGYASHIEWSQSSGWMQLSGTTSSRTTGTAITWTNENVWQWTFSNGQFSSPGDVVAYSSDRRLKTNITNIDNALDKVLKLNGVHFNWADDIHERGFHGAAPGEKAVGVIAQEVEAVLPELVAPAPFDALTDEETGEYLGSKSGEDYKTVKYEKLTALLIEAVKELSAKVDSQQEEIDRLKGL